jgi:DNA-binding CsgD family transcriptional regulator
MSVRFSSDDLLRITRAIRTLTDPFSHESTDAWRLTVNREVRELLGASSAAFLLPGAENAMLSEEHDQKALAGFPDLLPPTLLDGTPIWSRMIELQVSTLEIAYGPAIDRYYGSAYYNDYAAANGARETIAAAFASPEFGVGGWTTLHFWNDRVPRPPRFSERDVEILRLLFPAFRAGVMAQFRYGGIRARMRSLIDQLDVAVMVCDLAGHVLHQTPALDALLANDAEAATLRDQLTHIARSPNEPTNWSGVVSTATARYRISIARHPSADDPRRLLRLVTIERLTPHPWTAEELRREFRLTPAECGVTRLLAAGKSNQDVAAALSISPSTARRHTEQVLKKLDVRSRAEVAAKLAR